MGGQPELGPIMHSRAVISIFAMGVAALVIASFASQEIGWGKSNPQVSGPAPPPAIAPPVFISARPDARAPTIVLGQYAQAKRQLETLSLSYPEAAVQTENGDIFIANALGLTLERVRGDNVETVMADIPGSRAATVYGDLAQDGGKLFALESTNARIWEINPQDGSAALAFAPPPAPVFVTQTGLLWEAVYHLSSLSVREGVFLSVATRVKPSQSVQSYGFEPPSLFYTKGGVWQKIAIGDSIVARYGPMRDAVWAGKDVFAALAGSKFVLFDLSRELSAIDIGAAQGGGILKTDDGWLVGAHANLIHVSQDFKTAAPVPLPYPPANIGHLSWARPGVLLLTDTDRQTVVEMDYASKTVLRKIGNVGVGMKITALDVQGSKLLILENATPRVLSYDPKDARIAVIAGDGVQGYDSAGPALDFSFQYPSRMAVAPGGSIFVSEANYRLTRIENGRVEIAAGDIHPGTPREGDQIGETLFGTLRDMGFDPAGRQYIVDESHHSVWAVAVDGRISKLMGTGQPGLATEGMDAAKQPLNTPTGILVRANHDILIADAYNNVIWAVDSAGRVQRFAGKPIVTEYQGFGGYSGDGGLATEAELNTPRDMVEDADGNVYIVDEFNNAIRKVTPDGRISTFAGGRYGFSSDGSALQLPQAAAVLDGFLYVADTGNSVLWAFPLR